MSGGFDKTVFESHQAAVASHGDLDVTLQDYAQYLRHIAERYLGPNLQETVVTEFVSRLHTSDLFLSLACARGTEQGWRRFGSLYRKYLADLTRHLLGGASDPDDLGQALWIDLFLPDRSGHSRIASYDGRSSLTTWLRVVVSNRIINERQRKSFRLSNLEGIREPADPTALQKMEAKLWRDRYDPIILNCFERAFSGLTARERLIVLLRYDQNLQLGDIAQLFSVHQSTITRQIDRAVSRIRRDVMRILSTEYGLGQAEMQECLNVASDAFASSFSILTFLKDAMACDNTLKESYSSVIEKHGRA